MEKEIRTIEKNSSEDIRVQLTNFKGHDLVDVRIWTRPGPGETDEKPKPTKKGICVSPRLIPEIIDALHAADAAYQEGEGKRAN